jgi:hypothetical protein
MSEDAKRFRRGRVRSTVPIEFRSAEQDFEACVKGPVESSGL